MHVGEKLVGQRIAFDDQLLSLGEAAFLALLADEQPFVCPVVVKPAEDVVDLARGDGEAEVVAGNCLQRVGFVEDDRVVIRQDAEPPTAAGRGR